MDYIYRMFDIFKKKRSADSFYFYLIDDEEDVLEIISEHIKETFPCQVKTFLNINDALTSLESETIAPDLIYSDIMMGDVSGLSIIKKLEEINSTIPVLFITGLKGQEGLHSGYWSINKPVSTASLEKYTFHLLGKKKL
jgi:DNA-binding NtrC family response regulator